MKREITKLVADGLYTQALSLYSHYHARSFRPGKFTFSSLLKACAKLKSLPQGHILHAHLLKAGFQAHIYTATALSDMYIKFHLFDNAVKVFDEITQPNLTSLNVAISGFSQNGYCQEAFRMFRVVCMSCLRPDSVTVASLLSASRHVEEGCQVHCWVIKIGVDQDIYAATSVVTMYANCGEMVLASNAFNRIENKNLVCYNAFVSGLVQNGVPLLVLQVFKEIKRLYREPNSVTLISVLSACSDIKYLQFGKQVHGFIVQFQVSSDSMVLTALLDMYSKCGCWQAAYDLFKGLNGRRNLITWNSMIAGMMLNGQSENAIELFMQLESEGLKPDSATWNSMISGFSQLGKDFEAYLFFNKMVAAGIVPNLKCITSLLPVCAAMLALRCGKEIHAYCIRTDISRDEFIATALIDMYMKCGKPIWARKVFDRFEKTSNDPAIWNAMISGYGRNGEYETAFELFNYMLVKNVRPNTATFNCILSVCGHSGQVDKGREIFKSMNLVYGLKPTTEHFSCMVDLLGRSGHLDEARELLQEIPEPSGPVFSSLLGASMSYSDSKLGEEMAIRLIKLEPDNPAPYVILSNMYAGQGRWKDAESVREMINKRELRKLPAISLISVT